MRSLRDRAGFGLVSAIFILVVLTIVGAAMLSLSGVQRETAGLALQPARAYHAARSGIEWGTWQALDGGACPAPASFSLTEGGLIGFSVNLSCTSSDHTEAGSTARVYQIVSVATYGAFGGRDHVRRRLQVVITDA